MSAEDNPEKRKHALIIEVSKILDELVRDILLIRTKAETLENDPSEQTYMNQLAEGLAAVRQRVVSLSQRINLMPVYTLEEELKRHKIIIGSIKYRADIDKDIFSQ